MELFIGIQPWKLLICALNCRCFRWPKYFNNLMRVPQAMNSFICFSHKMWARETLPRPLVCANCMTCLVVTRNVLHFHYCRHYNRRTAICTENTHRHTCTSLGQSLPQYVPISPPAVPFLGDGPRAPESALTRDQPLRLSTWASRAGAAAAFDRRHRGMHCSPTLWWLDYNSVCWTQLISWSWIMVQKRCAANKVPLKADYGS